MDAASSVPVGCLAPAGNRPLVAHAVDLLAAAGADPVALSHPGTLGPPLRSAAGNPGAWPASTALHEARDGSSDLANLLAARASLGVGRVAVHAADALVDVDLAELEALAADQEIDAVAVVSRPAAEQRRGRFVPAAHAGERMESQVPLLLLGEHALELLAQLEERGQAIPFERFAPALSSAGGRIHRLQARRVCHFRAGAEGLLEANRMALDRIVPSLPAGTWDDTTVHGPVRIDAGARIRGSVIRGPVVVGPDARIEDSYVGPYTAIGAGAVVAGTEVEHSVLMAGAELRHVGGRLEGSVLGEGACVSRAFTLPRALHLHLGPRAEVTLAD